MSSDLKNKVGDAPKVCNLVFKKTPAKREDAMNNWTAIETLVRKKTIEVSNHEASIPCAIVDKQVSPADGYAQIGNHINVNVAMTATASLTRWRMHISR